MFCFVSINGIIETEDYCGLSKDFEKWRHKPILRGSTLEYIHNFSLAHVEQEKIRFVCITSQISKYFYTLRFKYTDGLFARVKECKTVST